MQQFLSASGLVGFDTYEAESSADSNNGRILKSSENNPQGFQIPIKK